MWTYVVTKGMLRGKGKTKRGDAEWLGIGAWRNSYVVNDF